MSFWKTEEEGYPAGDPSFGDDPSFESQEKHAPAPRSPHRNSRSNNTKTGFQMSLLRINQVTSEMSVDMQDILSPTFDTDTNNTIATAPNESLRKSPTSPQSSTGTEFSFLSRSYSSDSIIRKVEEEIAAARLAAASAKSRLSDPKIPQNRSVFSIGSLGSGDEDMKTILDVYADDNDDNNGGGDQRADDVNQLLDAPRTPSPRRFAADVTATDVFGNEDEDTESVFELVYVEPAKTNDSSEPFFDDEEWQVDNAVLPAPIVMPKFEDKSKPLEPVLEAAETETDEVIDNKSFSVELLQTSSESTPQKELHAGIPTSEYGVKAQSETAEIPDTETKYTPEPIEARTTPLPDKCSASKVSPEEHTLEDEKWLSDFAASDNKLRIEVPASPVGAGRHAGTRIASPSTKSAGSSSKAPLSPSASSVALLSKAATSPRKRAPTRSLRRKPEVMRSENTAPVLKKNVPIDSRLIRFGNPFPLLKAPQTLRDPRSVIDEHTIGEAMVRTKWTKPTKTLKQLIVAVMGLSLQRRSNACGALKVLAKERKNQLSLVRMDSFLAALIFAVSEDIAPRERQLALDARTRAMATLHNVCEPKENRIRVFTHPGLTDCLMKVILDDLGEARVLATGTFALLAKTPACREGITQTEGLVSLLADVLRGVRATPKLEPREEKNGGDVIQRKSTEASSVCHSDDDESCSDSESSCSSDDESRELPDAGMKHFDSVRKITEGMTDDFLQRTRSNACATVLHLSKHCPIVSVLCRSAPLMHSLVTVSKESTNPIHTKCLEIIGNLTRFPPNNGVLSRCNGVVDVLVLAAEYEAAVDRSSALRALQNISADASSKSLLANNVVLGLLTACSMSNEVDEKEAALAALLNISTEPNAVVSITNTNNLVATLIHLAHSPESSSNVRLIACEALATLSYWLQTLAGKGNVPEGIPNVPLPSQNASGWERWT